MHIGCHIDIVFFHFDSKEISVVRSSRDDLFYFWRRRNSHDIKSTKDLLKRYWFECDPFALNPIHASNFRMGNAILIGTSRREGECRRCRRYRRCVRCWRRKRGRESGRRRVSDGEIKDKDFRSVTYSILQRSDTSFSLSVARSLARTRARARARMPGETLIRGREILGFLRQVTKFTRRYRHFRHVAARRWTGRAATSVRHHHCRRSRNAGNWKH